MHSTPQLVEQTLGSIPEYVDAFRKAFLAGKPVSFDNMALAIEAYEATLVTPDSPFDLYLKGDDKALDAQQKKGLKAFMDSGCSACHNGINRAARPTSVRPGEEARRQRAAQRRQGPLRRDQDPERRVRFRAAPLRNVALTAPYFHSGQVWELKDAVAIMATPSSASSWRRTTWRTSSPRTASGKQPRVEYPLLPASTETTPRPAE